MSLAISVRSEILKTKRTAAFYFTLIGASVAPLMFLVSILSHGLPQQETSGKDPINFIFKLATEINSLCIFPMFVVLICTLLPQIEYKNAGWKQLLTSPQTKLNIFIAKFLNIQLLMLLYMVATHLFTWVVIVVAHFVLPDLNVLGHSFNAYPLLVSYAQVYLSVLALCTIQFWIGLRSKNFLVPIAIGMVGWLIGTIMVLEYGSPSSVYIPYCFHAIRLSDLFKPKLVQVEWTSFVYAAAFLLLGFIDFRRRKMTK